MPKNLSKMLTMRGATPRVSIIILNYNNWKDTIECLESVYKMNYPNYDVIVVDNGSTDNSVEFIKAWANGNLKTKRISFKESQKNNLIEVKIYNEKEIKNILKQSRKVIPVHKVLWILKNNRNYGYAEGNNIGIKFALKIFKPDYVLLLNNDVIVDSNLLNRLIKFAVKHRNAVLIQPKILRYKDLKIDNVGFKCDIFGFVKARGIHEIDVGQYDSEIFNGFFYAAGACLLIHRKFLLKLSVLGFIDRLLFAYHDDVDLSWLARLMGYYVALCTNAICYHKGGATFNKLGKKYLVQRYFMVRNRLRVLIKNYSFRNLTLVLPITCLIDLATAFSLALYYKEPRHIFIFMKALLWNIRKLRNTLYIRRIVQSIRKVKDSDIMKRMEKVPFIELRYLLANFLRKFQTSS